MNTKAIGICIVFLGVFIMIATAVSLLMVFTKRSTPIQLFNLPPLRMNPGSLIPNLPGGFSLPGSGGGETSFEMYPADAINTMANITAHFFLSGFFLNVGYKLSSLGIQLIAAGKEGKKSDNTHLPVALRPNPPV